MEIWITFFGLVAVGGLLVFLVQRRGGRRDGAVSRSLDEAPPFDRDRNSATAAPRKTRPSATRRG